MTFFRISFLTIFGFSVQIVFCFVFVVFPGLKTLKISIFPRENAYFYKIDVLAHRAEDVPKITKISNHKPLKDCKKLLKKLVWKQVAIQHWFLMTFVAIWLPKLVENFGSFSGFFGFFARQVQHGPRIVPRAPQARPKSDPEGPRPFQNRPKSAPRAFQECPRAPQERPRAPKGHKNT